VQDSTQRTLALGLLNSASCLYHSLHIASSRSSAGGPFPVPTATVTASGVTLSAVSVAITAALCPQHFGAGLLLVI
jgi:hypothetical protein